MKRIYLSLFVVFGSLAALGQTEVSRQMSLTYNCVTYRDHANVLRTCEWKQDNGSLGHVAAEWREHKLIHLYCDYHPDDGAAMASPKQCAAKLNSFPRTNSTITKTANAAQRRGQLP
jgi:hypothetical protein